MRHPILLQAVMAILLLGSAPLQAEEKYPAAAFEPQVIYQSSESGAPAGNAAVPVETSPNDSRYPAASFTPQVLFQDPELIESTGPLVANESAGSEPAQAATTGGRDITAAHVRPSGTISDSSPPYGILVLALGLFGLVFWLSTRKEDEATPQDAEPVSLAKDTAESPSASESSSVGGGDDDLHALAEEVEATMASSNRQRANKSKRVRRR